MHPISVGGKPTALVTGASGQDGYYLCRRLLQRGARVVGAVRDPRSAAAEALARDLPGLSLIRFELREADSIRGAVERSRPDWVFHLAGMSNVKAAWRDPAAALEINAVGAARLIEAVERAAPEARLVLAGSGDCFDHAAAAERGVTPQTPLLCMNPYAVSKCAAMQSVACARREKSLKASTAILFNHTSPRRPEAFVEMKIVRGAVDALHGRAERLVLGSLDAKRDWSWAEDVVDGLIAMAERDAPEDYVLASGELHSTGDWVRRVFDKLGLSLERHFRLDPSRAHRGDRPHARGDIAAAVTELGWRPRVRFEEIVDRILATELESAERSARSSTASRREPKKNPGPT